MFVLSKCSIHMCKSCVCDYYYISFICICDVCQVRGWLVIDVVVVEGVMVAHRCGGVADGGGVRVWLFECGWPGCGSRASISGATGYWSRSLLRSGSHIDMRWLEL